MEEMKHSHEHHHEHHHDCSCGTEGHEHQGCDCHHHHHHKEGGLKSKLFLIGATIILLIIAVFIEKEYSLATWQLLLVYLIPYLLIGHETLGEAAEGIAKGDMFNENFLMAIATIGALCIGFFPGSDTEFPEAVFVMLFFQVGELFEGYAEGKSRDSISHLMKLDVFRELSVNPIEKLHIIGGGSRNKLLNQFTSNAIGLPGTSGHARSH